MRHRLRDAFAALLLFALGACGGAPSIADTAQAALNESSHAVVQVDAIAEVGYRRAAERELAAAESMDDYRERIRPWDELARVLETARRVLYAAQSALDAAILGDAGETWLATVPCLLDVMRQLAAAVAAAGVEVPELLREAIALASGFGRMECLPASEAHEAG